MGSIEHWILMALVGKMFDFGFLFAPAVLQASCLWILYLSFSNWKLQTSFLNYPRYRKHNFKVSVWISRPSSTKCSIFLKIDIQILIPLHVTCFFSIHIHRKSTLCYFPNLRRYGHWALLSHRCNLKNKGQIAKTISIKL